MRSLLLSLVRWLLALIGIFVAVYVIYAHAASIATAHRYLDEPEQERFDSATKLASRYELRTRGALQHEVAGQKLRVHGTTTFEGGEPARVDLVGRPRTLTEGSFLMRFRAVTKGAYDVTLGIESDHSGKGKQALRFGLRNDTKDPGFSWDGDSLMSLVGQRITTGFGDSLDRARRIPLATDGDEWHEVSLQLSSSLHQIFATVDGIPTSSIRTEWLVGLPVRLVFGVVAREPGQDVDVEFEQVVYEPLLPDPGALDFFEKFDGRVIDPRRFRIQQADSFWMDASAVPSRDGLVLEGRARRVRSSHPGLEVYTLPFDLSSVYVRAKVKVIDLHHGGFFMGLRSSLGGVFLRVYDTGFFDAPPEADGRPRFKRFVAGNWTHDGQSRFEAPLPSVPDDETTVEIDYDAKSRVGRIRYGGQPFFEQTLDLQPREEVSVRFGVNIGDEEAHYKVIVKEFRLRALKD